MKKQNLMMLATVAVVLATSGCGKKNQQVVDNSNDSTPRQEIEYIYRDTTLYGLCGEGSAMNTLQLYTDTGDTLNLSLVRAKDNDCVLGGYGVGDRMAVLPSADRQEALIVINLNALLGNWVMPNPIDGSSETGIRIKEGGVLEGIDQSSIIYKTWKINNGQLEILSQREGGGDEEETALFDITVLTPDSLVIRNSEDLFEYGRQQIHEHKSKVKFEDSNPDDFLM